MSAILQSSTVSAPCRALAGSRSRETPCQVLSHSADDIACWLVDTSYDGESFFVRQAYLTGADEPYEKLKRALRAEVDEDAWTTLYPTIRLPFAPPTAGEIAAKVINHYGDELLGAYEVGGRRCSGEPRC